MNKTDLIDNVSDTAEVSKADAGRAVDAVFQVIADTLKNGDKVQLAGFGSFEVSHRAARVGRNPRTKEPIQIPASNVPKFKAGKALKEAVN